MHTKLHIFQSGSEDLFGLTEDRSGANLPREANGADWRYVRTVQFDGGLPPWGLDIAWQDNQAAVAAGIAQNGFFLAERSTLPAPMVTPDGAVPPS